MTENLSEKGKVAFQKFSPFIRDYIYRNGWNELRRVQIEAAHEIYFTERNILISSETASGKTEAVLFPILSLMEKESPENFIVLYISPLKALINDQFSRMETLLSESHLPVFRWHGDVDQNHKSSFFKIPSGLLQITPESLESLLCRKHNDIPRLFANLKYVIIDEIHSLFGSDRGYQILCQLQRIAQLICYDPRRIALSATIGEPQKALAWLNGGSTRDGHIIKIDSEKATWKLGIDHFYVNEADKAENNAADRCIYSATKNKKCVIFSNSREETEAVCSSLRMIAKQCGETDRFYIHHGSLSASIRENTEAALKNDDKAITACATVTLELGVDIGKLQRIINQGAPQSVSGFLQRMGRSGRRGNTPEMLLIFREEETLSSPPFYQSIPWDLIQAIAIIELYLKERWIEPCSFKSLPASLLFHQTLSILSANTSLSPAELAKRVLSLSPFEKFTKEEYKELLIHMLKEDYLQRTEDNELIVGMKGERLAAGYRFFSVFKDNEDITVRCGAEDIGTITTALPVGERFALAGRAWEVEETDASRRVIYVKNVEGKTEISWSGSQGIIHTRILEKMRDVLFREETYSYLSPKALTRLQSAITLANKNQIAKHHLISLCENSFVLFPWLGTRAFQALKRIIKKYGSEIGISDIQSAGCYYITFQCKQSKEDILKFLYSLKEREMNDIDLIGKNELLTNDKYDHCLPKELVNNAYAKNVLCLDEAMNRINMLQ